MCNELAVSQFELPYRQTPGRVEENHLCGMLEDKKVPRWVFLNLPSITSTCNTQRTCSVRHVSVSRKKPLPAPRFSMTRKHLTRGPILTAKPNSGDSWTACGHAKTVECCGKRDALNNVPAQLCSVSWHVTILHTRWSQKSAASFSEMCQSAFSVA
jgi:hypothetical protein